MEDYEIEKVYKLLGEICNMNLDGPYMAEYKAREIKILLDKNFKDKNNIFEKSSYEEDNEELNYNIRIVNGESCLMDGNTKLKCLTKMI